MTFITLRIELFFKEKISLSSCCSRSARFGSSWGVPNLCSQGSSALLGKRRGGGCGSLGRARLGRSAAPLGAQDLHSKGNAGAGGAP
ncbi:Uncharacterized protein TCM_039201 [Theobroma cacao]|uniref:Uncharacterized protein n=1 Tax=Theobroma cacao TaxID=3641 RepID=A0A061GXL9_THECC|nr:Uncharacterized protein TCM_039201 [Theobroma cacao]